MHEVWEELHKRWHEGETLGLSTVVATSSSAPRPPGASMMVGADGTVVGSVSGGCVESAVYDRAVQVLSDRRPVLERYGVSDDDAFAVGLTCGGIIDVYVECVDQGTYPELGEILASVRAGNPVAVATVTGHEKSRRLGRRMVVWPDRATGTLGTARMDAAVADDAREMLAGGKTGTLTYPAAERRGKGMTVFVQSFEPPPRMLVFGAIDFAAAMARMGSYLDYVVTVCDARPVFATASRFPEADAVVVDWPHRYLAAEARAGRVDRRTVVAVLTHDPKFDVPLLDVALRLDLGYVGAMGSRRTHRERTSRLLQAGLTEAELAGLSSPIGLDLGGRTPEETAVSIAAEIIALRWGGRGLRLTGTSGHIHP